MTGSAAKKRVRPQAERTRQVVLNAAFSLLEDEGLDALRHARLAEVSGVSRMTLYRHWPTPFDLWRDTLEQAAKVTHAEPTGEVVADLKREMQILRRQLLTPSR